MPVSTKVIFGIHLEALAALRVQCNSLLPCGLEVLHKVDYRVPVRRPRILEEAGTLMRRIGDVGPSALLKEVEISHDGSIVEALVETSGGGVAAQDLCGQSRNMSRPSVLGELDVVDDAVNDLRLC